ncbi:hypothetical protein ACEPPN_018826 [Leptodophora sp. 'Broadleaf-Isolate-01']
MNTLFLLAVSFVAVVSQAVAAEDAATQHLGWSGKLSSLDAGLGGVVTVTSPTTLTISEYTLKEASAPALYWWGSETAALKDGFRISNTQVTKEAESPTLEIALNNGKTSADFVTVGLWCERFAVNFGQAALAKGDGSVPVATETKSAGTVAATETVTKESGGKSVKKGLKSAVVVGVAAVAGSVAVLIV